MTPELTTAEPVSDAIGDRSGAAVPAVDPEAVSALADAVLLPGFDGTEPPEWVLRRVSRGLGGVCLFSRNIADPDQVRTLTATLRRARPEVIIAIDEEAGDVTRIDSATGSRFPGAAALGRADDVAGTAEIGRQVGTVLAGLGITLNLAPCADVALDPQNPVIGTRAFGADPDLVARHAAAFVTGQQAAGVAACAKHFPGHGDTAADTHLDLAVLDASLEELTATALPPFASTIAAGVSAVMSGHLLVPSVDALPATLSRVWLTDILRGKLGFDGVVITDALEMAAVAGTFGIAEAAVLALLAGADLLCLGGEDAGEALVDDVRAAIVEAVLSQRLPLHRLADAAARAATLGARSVPPTDATDDGTADRLAGEALQIAGPLPALVAPMLVLRCEEPSNIAVGPIPWGLAIGAAGGPAGPAELPIRSRDPIPDDIRSAGSVLIATRDRHRHPWMGSLLDRVRTVRPDAVLVEMGTTGVGAGDAPALASFGASRANARAALRALGMRLPSE